MVVKTDVCNYSDLRIYPGHGVKIISRDGKIQIYIHKKARCQAQRKIKPQRIKWTTSWRRMNKKIKSTELTKKRRRKPKRVVRYQPLPSPICPKYTSHHISQCLAIIPNNLYPTLPKAPAMTHSQLRHPYLME
jgi:ribosomal protein L24E